MMVPLERVEQEEYKNNSGTSWGMKQQFRWATRLKGRFWIQEKHMLWP